MPMMLLESGDAVDLSGKGWHGKVFGLDEGMEIIGSTKEWAFVKGFH